MLDDGRQSLMVLENARPCLSLSTPSSKSGDLEGEESREAVIRRKRMKTR
jgi:hypothetical protein